MKNKKQKKIIEISLFKIILVILAIVSLVFIFTFKGDITSTKINAQILKFLGETEQTDTEGPKFLCPWIYGDANDDYNVTQDDITLLEEVIAGNEELTDIGVIQADVNFDKVITDADITAIRNYLDGEGNLPVEEYEPEELIAYKVTETEIHIITAVIDEESGLKERKWGFKEKSAENYTYKTTAFDEPGPKHKTILTYDLTNLTPGKTYNISFEIRDSVGNVTSTSLEVETIKTVIDEDREGPILTPVVEGLDNNLNAYNITETGFSVNIYAQDISGLKKAIWYFKKEAETDYETHETEINSQGNTKKELQFSLTDYPSDTMYDIYVVVYDNEGNFTESNHLKVKTLPAQEVVDEEGPILMPDQDGLEQSLNAYEITESGFVVKIAAQDEISGLKKYVLYYKKQNEADFKMIEKNVTNQGSTNKNTMTFTFENLESETTYELYVIAYDMKDNPSRESNHLNVTTKTVEEPKIEINEGNYEIEDLKIKNISPDTKLEDLLENLDITAQSYKVVNNKNEEMEDADLIGTGSKIVLNDEIEYILIVTGDVNGDGKVEIYDLIAVNKHRLKKNPLEDIYFEAGNVNNDNVIDIYDLIQINKARLGKINL